MPVRPTVATLLRFVKLAIKFCSDLFGLQEILVCNLNKMAIGVHTPSGGIDLRLSRDLIRSTRLNVRAWTARWPIRKVSDLARPMP